MLCTTVLQANPLCRTTPLIPAPLPPMSTYVVRYVIFLVPSVQFGVQSKPGLPFGTNINSMKTTQLVCCCVCCLQHACGYEYTNKLHRMFTDISISSDLNSSFNDFLSKANASLGVGFSLFVLQVSVYFCFPVQYRMNA